MPNNKEQNNKEQNKNNDDKNIKKNVVSFAKKSRNTIRRYRWLVILFLLAVICFIAYKKKLRICTHGHGNSNLSSPVSLPQRIPRGDLNVASAADVGSMYQ